MSHSASCRACRGYRCCPILIFDERVRVRPGPRARVESLQPIHLVLVELEVEHVEVLSDPERRDGLGYGDASQLKMPAQNDLAGGPFMALGELAYGRGAQRHALGKRAPGLGDDPGARVKGAKLALLKQ